MKLLERILFRGIPYLGIGFLCCALFVGPVLDWTDPMTFAWLFAWPPTAIVVAVLASAYYAFLAIAGIVVAGTVWYLVEKHALKPIRRARIRKNIEMRHSLHQRRPTTVTVP